MTAVSADVTRLPKREYEGTSGVTAITNGVRNSFQNSILLDEKHGHLISTHSPVSVLKSQSESQHSGLAQHTRTLESNFNNIGVSEPSFVHPVKKKRTPCTRARPAHFINRFTFPCASARSSVSDNFYHFETFPTEQMLNPEKRKQKKKMQESGEIRETKGCMESGDSRETKRCTHCAVMKTPQWREGPLGPKTLCNACGVRYRSGRLFPEYCPAASPTFVPAVHSNSHKKVIELRNKGYQGS